MGIQQTHPGLYPQKDVQGVGEGRPSSTLLIWSYELYSCWPGHFWMKVLKSSCFESDLVWNLALLLFLVYNHDKSFKTLRAQFPYLQIETTILRTGGRSEHIMDRKRPICRQHVGWIITVEDLAWCGTKGSWLASTASLLFRTLNSFLN